MWKYFLNEVWVDKSNSADDVYNPLDHTLIELHLGTYACVSELKFNDNFANTVFHTYNLNRDGSRICDRTNNDNRMISVDQMWFESDCKILFLIA